MFEKASKMKLRFASTSGYLSVEDLWDIALVGALSLNSIAKAVNRKLTTDKEEDFVEDKVPADNINSLRLDILKHIIGVKKANAAKAEKAQETRQRNQRILALLDEKADDKLKAKSEAQLRKMLEGED